MEAPQPSLRRLDLHYIAMQIGYWAMFAAICAYLAALLGERGFSNSRIGLLIAIRCLAGIICQPLLGGFADRHPEIPLKVIVSLSLALSLAASLAFLLWPMGMGGTAVILIILGGFEISAYPLMDAMAIQFINAGMPIRYSLGRGIGSMAYAVTCAGLGLQTQAVGVESTLITHAVLVAAVIALTITYPAFHAASAAADAPPAEKPHSVWYLLKNNPPFALMLLAILLGITACLPMSNFLVNVVESRGGGSADLGVALFLMGGFELPTAFFFQRMLRRLGKKIQKIVKKYFHYRREWYKLNLIPGEMDDLARSSDGRWEGRDHAKDQESRTAHQAGDPGPAHLSGYLPSGPAGPHPRDPGRAGRPEPSGGRADPGQRRSGRGRGQSRRSRPDRRHRQG